VLQIGRFVDRGVRGGSQRSTCTITSGVAVAVHSVDLLVWLRTVAL
jgi:hypothetical protein